MHHPSSKCCKCTLCIVLALPNVLQNELYCVWLGLTDLGRLDSAICNKTHRDALLDAWNDEHCILTFNAEIVVSELFAAWVGNRRMKVRSAVAITEFVSETEACKDFFKATGNTLTKIKYPAVFSFKLMDPAVSAQSMQSLVQRVSSCVNLEKVVINHIDMSKASLRSMLTKCTKLKSLELGYAQCLDFRELNEYGRYIEELKVELFTGTIAPKDPDRPDIAVMKKTSSMKILHFECTKFWCDCNRIVRYVGTNVGLRELALNVGIMNLHQVIWILESCPELLALRVQVRRDDNMEDADMTRLIGLMQHLRYVLISTDAFTDAWLLQLLKKCTQLRFFSVVNFQNFPATALKDMCSLCTKCNSPLSVLHVNTIHTETLSEILCTYPHLTNVGIFSSTIESFDAALRVLSNYKVTELYLSVPSDYAYTNIHLLHGLTSLSLYKCVSITDEHLLTIARNNPCLSTLLIGRANLITSDAVLELAKTCQKLTCLHVYADFVLNKLHSLNTVLQHLCPSLVTISLFLRTNR